MTPEELATIEARANEAQPGPWWVVTVGKNHDDGPSHVIMSEHVSITEAFAGGEIPQATDAAFMAKSRTDVPDLIAEVRRLTAERDAAFARGVEAMREAAAKACESHWLGGDREPARETSRVLAVVATDIRALKVAP
jgi:outer membrane murein-binding lipoprotein Lpp